MVNERIIKILKMFRTKPGKILCTGKIQCKLLFLLRADLTFSYWGWLSRKKKEKEVGRERGRISNVPVNSFRIKYQKTARKSGKIIRNNAQCNAYNA